MIKEIRDFFVIIALTIFYFIAAIFIFIYSMIFHKRD